MLALDTQKEITQLLSRYPIKRNALLPILHVVQKGNGGYLTPELLEEVAGICEVSQTHVEGVISFYTMYKLEKPGKFHLQVCTCVPCCLVGGEELLEHVEQQLDTHAGHTADDGVFSVEEVECLGACSYAPAVIVNEDYHEQMNPEKLDRLMDELRTQGQAHA